MLRWMKKSNQNDSDAYTSTIDGMKKVYKKFVRPLEELYRYQEFYSPLLTDSDFDAPPTVMLLGQYSTGKTTFIKYLLETDYPGLRIGPEPTTDKFVAIMHGEQDQIIPGNALVVDQRHPYKVLTRFGNNFLQRFEAAVIRNPVLQGLNLLDTPGVLAGAKQTVNRGYDFTGVVKWFADRVDMIVMLFDAHKLDISDEFSQTILACKGNDTKIRIVLNKADKVTNQQLMRVYGALMWSLGKVLGTPEVARVYIGSFWDQPYTNDDNRKLFEMEEEDLFKDIQSVPRGSIVRKLNDLVKRCRIAKTHAYIMSHIKNEMPVFGKEAKMKQIIANLPKIFQQLEQTTGIPAGDFPNVEEFQEKLKTFDITKLAKLNQGMIDALDKMIATELPRLMAQVPQDQELANDDYMMSVRKREGGALFESDLTPFGDGATMDILNSPLSVKEFQYEFEKLGPSSDGKINGTQAKQPMQESKLPNATLRRIWTLSDLDKDGKLDLREFAICKQLIKMKLDGHDLPIEVPDIWVSPMVE